MSSKINAIYDALDNGNPKAALRLCQAYLQKTSSNLVKALMALTLSRLDQSAAAVAVCEEVVKSNPDAHAVETLTYVLRREQQFPLLAQLLTNTIEKSPSPTRDMLIDCFVANLQSGHHSPLSQLSMKLYKLTNEPKFLAWYAFALTRGPFPDTETETKILGMAILSLDKVISTARPPSPEGMNRWSTSGRMNFYLRLFKMQIFVKLGQHELAIEEVKKIDSTLITDLEKDELIKDLENFSGKKPQKLIASPSDSVLAQIHHLVGLDALENGNVGLWSVGENHEQFVQLFSSYLSQAIDRSDCVVVCSPLLRLLEKDDIPVIIETLKSFIASTSSRTLVNVYKLLYALGEELPTATLLSLSKPLVESENCLDECSPGKQFLLLAAISYMQQGEIMQALSLLSYGSNRFSHCSHFRLLECIVYSHSLGWSNKGLDRFEALGIKNAQWRSLFWLIEPIVSSGYITSDRREHISLSIHNFFDRHNYELKQNFRLLVDECMFWKFDSDNTADLSSPSKIWTEVEKYWSELIEDFEVTQEMQHIEIADEIESLEYDYSPLLFTSICQPGQVSTKKFWKSLMDREAAKPRGCGFMWNKDQLWVSREVRFEKFSKKTFPGNLLVPTAEESGEFLRLRQDVMREIVCILKGEKEIQSIVIPDQFTPFYKELVDLMIAVRSSTLPSNQDQIEAIITRLSDVLETVEATTLTIPRVIGTCLNGWIQAVVVLLEFTGNKFPKKSEDRKSIRMMLKRIAEKLGAINKALEVVKNYSIQPPASTDYFSRDFVKKISTDFRGEIDIIKAGFKSVIDRINVGKV